MEITITISTLTITGQDIMIPLMFVIYVGVMIWLFKHKKPLLSERRGVRLSSAGGGRN